MLAVEPVPFIAVGGRADLEFGLYDVGMVAALFEWKADLCGFREFGIAIPLPHFRGALRIFRLPLGA